jgi:hypothetical protein
MRGFVSYTFAGIAVVLTMDTIVPPASLGWAVIAWPAVGESAPSQVVNRDHKSDRLQVPLANDRRTVPPAAPSVLIGCEPIFSPLSRGIRANFPGRCLA